MRGSVRFPVRRPNVVFGLASLAGALAAGALLGLLVLGTSPAIPGWSSYKVVFVALAGLAFIGILLAGNVRRVLLVSLVLAIPLNFGFSPLGDVQYHAGGAPAGLVLYLYDFPLIGLVLLSGLEALVRRRPVHFSGVDVAAVLLILWTALSIYNSSQIPLSVYEILRMGKLYLLSRVIAGNVNTRRDVTVVLVALLAGLMFQGAVGVLQYAFGLDLNIGLYTVGELRRVTGMLHWPVTFGTYVGTMVSLGFTFYICDLRIGSRIMIWAACIVGFLALILTFSRGPWIALLAGVAFSLWLGWRASWIDTRSIARLMGLALVAVLIVALFSRSVITRVAELDTGMEVIVDRMKLNQVALNMVGAHPLVGVGINTFVDVMQEYDTTGVSSYSCCWPVHNVYLLVAAETGVVGLGLFLLLLFSVFRQGFEAARSGDRFIAVYVVGLLSGLFSMMASNVAHFDLRGEEVLYASFWLLIGLVVAANRMTAWGARQGARREHHMIVESRAGV